MKFFFCAKKWKMKYQGFWALLEKGKKLVKLKEKNCKLGKKLI